MIINIKCTDEIPPLNGISYIVFLTSVSEITYIDVLGDMKELILTLLSEENYMYLHNGHLEP